MVFYAPNHAVLSVFLFLMAGLYFLLAVDYAQTTYSDSLAFNFFSIFWLPSLIMIPLLTMRLLAEDRKLGLWDTFLTASIPPYTLVWAKFLAAYVFYGVAWGLTYIFPHIFTGYLGQTAFQAGVMDSTSLIGGYLFIGLTATAYLPLGLLASSLTKSQFAAGTLGFIFLFIVIVGPHFVLNLPWAHAIHGLSDIVQMMDPFMHLDDFCRGIIDTRPSIFYPACGLCFLGLSTLSVRG